MNTTQTPECDIAVGTIVAKNYLSHARVLAKSFRRFHPEIPFVALLSDEVDGYFEPQAESLELVGLSDIGIPNVERFRFKYSRKQLAAAVKPYLLSYLLARGFHRAVFLDPDTLVMANLQPLFASVREHGVVLLSHLLDPPTAADAIERELSIIQPGVFNAGCLGVAAMPSGWSFLRWWQDRIYDNCRNAVAEGLYYDQIWLNLAPSFFDDVSILRDPGFNVAYWNLPERHVSVDGEQVRVDGQPCRLFHFSGFKPDSPQAVTRYSKRLEMSNIGPAAEIYRRYAALLVAEGYDHIKAWPYAYDRFDNGAPISKQTRRAYRDLGDRVIDFGDPLKTQARTSFYRWLRRRSGLLGKMRRLWWSAHRWCGRRLPISSRGLGARV